MMDLHVPIFIPFMPRWGQSLEEGLEGYALKLGISPGMACSGGAPSSWTTVLPQQVQGQHTFLSSRFLPRLITCST